MPTNPIQSYDLLKLEPAYDADQARQRSVNIAPSQTIVKGTVLGELTATPGTFKPYASGNSDGSQVPKCLAVYNMVTDASGNITLTTTAGQAGGTLGETFLSAPVYVNGPFLTTDLTGLDANAVTVLGAHFESGVLANGVIRIP